MEQTFESIRDLVKKNSHFQIVLLKYYIVSEVYKDTTRPVLTLKIKLSCSPGETTDRIFHKNSLAYLITLI